MIVCLCVGVSDTELKQMIDAGMTLKEIQAECGAGLGCGSCLKMIQNELDEQGIQSNPEKLEGLTKKEALAKIPHSIQLRVVNAGQAMTMDYVPERLNLCLDKDGVVVRAFFG